MSQIDMIEMDKGRLADRIKTLRSSKGMKQREVAEKLQISRSAYAGYENGSRTIPLEKAIRLACLYHITVDELLNGDFY
ncbi:MAG: helix-turn-helix transcriptional regulator [Cyclobacteriaceae bacterium]